MKTYNFYDYKDFSNHNRGTIEIHSNYVKIVNHSKEYIIIPTRSIVSIGFGDKLYSERSNWYTYVQLVLINGDKKSFIFKYQDSDAQELETDIETILLSI